MILSSSDITKLINSDKPLIEDFTDGGLQLQPNGFDMCVKSIHKFKNSGEIGFNNSDRRLPLTEEVMDLCGVPYYQGYVNNPIFGVVQEMVDIQNKQENEDISNKYPINQLSKIKMAATIMEV